MAHPLIMYEAILIIQHIPNVGSDSTRIVRYGFASVVSVSASYILGESIHNEIGIRNILIILMHRIYLAFLYDRLFHWGRD